ncbi:MAG: hypothetical protein ACXV3V_00885 [Actinomycetes bacterium]
MDETRAPSAAHRGTSDSSRRRTAPIVVPTVRVHRVPLPRAHVPGVRVPSVHLPGADRLRPHVDPRSVRGRALWIGGLGGLVIVGVLDWPVAAAVAAGTWVAERRARAYLRDQSPATEPAQAAADEQRLAEPTIPRQAPAPAQPTKVGSDEPRGAKATARKQTRPRKETSQ